MRKLFQLRLALEPPASALAAAATEADGARIGEAFERMAGRRPNEAWVDADIEFHKSICRATHNEFFWPIAQMFEPALRESFRLSSPGAHRARAVAEHRDLMQAITGRDGERARAAALHLLGNSAKDLVKIRGYDLCKPNGRGRSRATSRKK